MSAILSSYLSENEHVVDGVFYPNSPYLCLITNLNRLHLVKRSVHLQTIAIQVSVSELIEENNEQNIFLTENISEEDKIKELEQTELQFNYLASCICDVDNGFAIGFAGLSLIHVYQFNQEDNLLYLKLSYRLRVNNIFRLHSMNYSQLDKQLIMVVQHTKSGLGFLMDDLKFEKQFKNYKALSETYQKIYQTPSSQTKKLILLSEHR